ncbi:MAG: hypothetical protein MZU79_06185 [Anaerotruncus sp.]|nr:hypothetical protein [Anaerotruncus sp.]
MPLELVFEPDGDVRVRVRDALETLLNNARLERGVLGGVLRVDQDRGRGPRPARPPVPAEDRGRPDGRLRQRPGGALVRAVVRRRAEKKV